MLLWMGVRYIVFLVTFAGAQQALAERVALAHEKGFLSLVLGGGHDVALGHGLGLLRSLEADGVPRKLGVINLDAHFDIRPAKGEGHSGTPFGELHSAFGAGKMPFSYLCLGIQEAANTSFLFSRAKALGVQYIGEDDWLAGGQALVHESLGAFMAEADVLYLSIDMDVFGASCAPGVSAPNPTGILPRDVMPVH